MKVTVNACRKRRIKVDVTAVNSRRDIIRIPVRRMDRYTGAAPEEETADIGDGFEEADLSAIFDSSEFQDPYYPEDDALPEIFVKPVRMLNELADSRPELDDLPPYFNPRLLTEEEDAAEYSVPERLVKEDEVTEEKAGDETAEGSGGDGGQKTAPKRKAAGETRRTNRRPAEQEIAESYTTEELLAIIESQQQEKKRRDIEQAELKKQRELERAEKARELEKERSKAAPTKEEISRKEDTLFMWWSELDSKDASNAEDGGASEENEAFTQMQITENIPKPRKRRRRKARPAPVDAGTLEDAGTGERAGERGNTAKPPERDSSGEIFDNIRGAFSTGTGEEEDDASGEVFDSIRGAFAGDIVTDDGDADEAAAADIGDAEELSAEEPQDIPEEYGEDTEEVYYEEEDPDTSVNVRYFDRDQHGGRVEVERSEAIGQEVVIIDNESGKMKRICGIIKHGQPSGDKRSGAPETEGTGE